MGHPRIRPVRASVLAFALAVVFLPRIAATQTYLVDTGPGGTFPETSLFGKVTQCSPPGCENAFQFLAGQITLAGGGTIDSIQAWMGTIYSGGDITVRIAATDGLFGFPGTALYSQTFTVAVRFSSGWVPFAFSAPHPVLPPGTYWVTFEPVAGATGFGSSLPGGAVHPLATYAIDNFGGWYASNANFGLRIAGNQITYQYTGSSFDCFYTAAACAPSPAGTSYRAFDRVTGALTVTEPLAPNLTFADVTTLPGFALSLNDGHQTLTQGAGDNVIAQVSTDASGQIVAPWHLAIFCGCIDPNNYIEVSNQSTALDQGFVRSEMPFDGASASLAGMWARLPRFTFGTATRITQDDPAAGPLDDIQGDAGRAVTTGFAFNTSEGIQAAYPRVTTSGLTTGAWSDSGHSDGTARGVAFRQYVNNTGQPQTMSMSAVLSGRFDEPWFGLPLGHLSAAASIFVFDSAQFDDTLSASGMTAGEYLMSGATVPALAFDALKSKFPAAALLAEGHTGYADGPFDQHIDTPLSTGLFTVLPNQTFTVVFDIATDSHTRFFGGQWGGGDVYFLDTLAPAPNLFVDANGDPVGGIVPSDIAAALPRPADSLTLVPGTSTNQAGTTHTVYAMEVDADDNPVVGAIVRFSVTDGPNAGVVGGGLTDAYGQAAFTYTDDGGAGTDSIQATAGTVLSNVATVTWTSPGPLDSIVVSPASTSVPAGTGQPYTATGFDRFGTSLGDVTAGTGFVMTPDGSCSGAICTATIAGPHTVTGTNGGKTAQAALSVTPVQVAPAINFGAAPAATYPGANFTVTATTNSDGALTYSYESGPCAQVSGGTFSPSGVGTCVIRARTAATANFLAGSATQSVTIASGTSTFSFSGFFAPVDNTPVFNSVKAGAAVPVKFSLGGNQGLNIFAPGHPASGAIACSATAEVAEIEQTVTAGSSSLSYDAGSDRYTYVWKTDKAWAGTCRMLVIKLTDGTTHTALFKLAK